MSDSHTTVTRTSWLGNIIGSIVGAGAGVLIFLFALALIWIGEGRTNLAVVAEKSVAADPARVDPFNEGRLLAVTGAIEAAPLGDDPFLAPGPYLRLERQVEMFAWVEEKRTERRDEVGGGTTERTTYSYTKRWTSSPVSGEGFNQPAGHRNPPMPVAATELSADGGHVGAYALNLAALDLPSSDELPLSPAMLRADDRWDLQGGYIFMGRGSQERPQVGDVRVSYRAVPTGLAATVFGEQRGEALRPFDAADDATLYRAVPGDRAEAIDYLSAEDTFIDWIIRLAALLMLWVGIALVLGPINAVLGVLPALKQAGGCLTSLISFVPAFAVWLVAVLVSVLAHNLWLLLGLVAVVLVGSFVLGRLWRPAPRAATA